MNNNYLSHYGIVGMRWGVRNGPPYPLKGGSYTKSELTEIYKKRRARNSIYNKKHFDEVIDANKDKLTTLSYDKDRTKNTDMFYASYDYFDKHQYNALFNRALPKTLYDDDGNNIGTGYYMKYKIDNSLKNNINVASEDSAAKVFMKLYENNRDFYNFVTDESRMQDYFVKDKYKFKSYREAKNVLDKMQDKSYTPTQRDLQTVYRMFNYVIPYDGAGDAKKGKDVQTQRAKFFNELKKEGYGAVLDTNDAIYGGFKAKSPVIVFDMDSVVPDSIRETKLTEQEISRLMLVSRKMFRL